MTYKEKKEDKRIWERMGRELAALHDLILYIIVDPDYQGVMDRKTWDRLNKLEYYLNIVRGDAENRMARFIPDWTTQTFYPVDRTNLNAAIKAFRDKMKEDTNE